MMNLHLKSVAAIGPGFADWNALREHFTTAVPLSFDAPVKAQGTCLPAVERRRASPTIKLAVDAAQAALRQSGLQAGEPALVFTTSGGDTNTLHLICEALATPERFVSPMNFHNSVHNGAAGYWSIAAGSMQPSTTLCAWEYSFAVGLLEAAVQCLADRIPVVLTAFDTPFPEPLLDKTPTHHAFSAAMLMDANPHGSIACLSLTLENRSGATTRMSEAALENLRLDSSAARALPLLETLAKGDAREIIFDYSADLQLRATITPPAS